MKMVEIKWPVEDFKKLSEQISLAATVLGKGQVEAVKWAAGNVCASLSASTRVSPKIRRVVPNPHPNAKTDGRRAKWGVMKYKRYTSELYFEPIYRTGEYGKVRFKDKKTLEWYTVDKASGKRVKETVNFSNDFGGSIPIGIMQSKKRNIGRSGLAKKAWQWAQAQVLSSSGSGTANLFGVPDIAEVRVSNSSSMVSFRVKSKLRYALDATLGGRKDVNTALLRAADSMRRKIDDKIKSSAGILLK